MALRKRTNAYWNKRANERLVESEKTSEEYRRQIRKLYDAAQKETLRQLKKIYADYWTKEGGFDKQKLKLMTSSGDMQKFIAKLKKAGLYEEIPANYLGRINRLEFLNAQMWYETHKAGLEQDRIITNASRKVYEDSYYRSVYDVSRGIGSTPGFSILDTRTVSQVLDTKFEGKNYSQRIWGNSDILADQLKQKLGQAIANGQAIQKTARDFRERFGVSNYYAERLVRTETNYFHNSAEIDSYKSMGFEYFEFVATLDTRTSEICSHMDGKRFKVSEGIPGDNVPPLHPNCRSTIVPYFKDFEPDETRMARNPATGKNYHVYDMTYQDWKQEFVDNVVNNIVGGKTNGGSLVLTDYGASFDSMSLWGVDGEILRAYSMATERLMNEFPQVKEWSLKRRKNIGLEIAGKQYKGGIMAATYRQKALIGLNPKYHYSMGKLTKTVNGGIRRHHFMPAKNLKTYVFNHEFGHYIENYLMDVEGLSATNIRNDIIKIAKERYGMTDNVISGYGRTNSHEFFAECFANHKGRQQNALGKAIGAYLKEKMK